MCVVLSFSLLGAGFAESFLMGCSILTRASVSFCLGEAAGPQPEQLHQGEDVCTGAELTPLPAVKLWTWSGAQGSCSHDFHLVSLKWTEGHTGPPGCPLALHSLEKKFLIPVD